MIVDHGNANSVTYAGGDVLADLSFEFRGSGNRVVIGANCTAAGARISLGDDCTVEIGDHSILNRLEIFAARRSTITIGDHAKFTWSVRIHAHEAFDVAIGRDCLFADGVWITVSDMHVILDKRTRERINPGGPIVIGEHVWLGASTTVLKNAVIGDGTVIGTGSIVSDRIPPDSIAAGIPARVLRSGVEWVNELP